MALLPEVITHNYDPGRGIGRNLCDLPKSQAEQILDEFRASGTRRIKADYLERRIAVEDWLIQERTKKLGRTVRARPIYFFLGDFADGRDPSRPVSLVLPLSAFPPETLTFTYPDSMASLPIATLDRHKCHRKPYHGHVFTLSEIKAVVAEFGLPGDRQSSDPTAAHDRFIEVQVWDDGPIRGHG
jgi:hypothetical protein